MRDAAGCNLRGVRVLAPLCRENGFKPFAVQRMEAAWRSTEVRMDGVPRPWLSSEDNETPGEAQ